jgi:hypothetical protein
MVANWVYWRRVSGTSKRIFATIKYEVISIRIPKTWKLVPSVEQSTENMKTGAIGGAEYLKHKNWCHQWSRVPKTWKLVPSVVQNTKNIKTGVISGAEYRKHENWCHQWSRVPKTWKLVPSVEQNTENMKTGAISHDQVDQLFV